MKNKLLLGIGVAAGYVLGSRSGRAAYDKLKARAAGIWDSKPVQDKVSVATETIREKAPEVADQLTEAARRAGTVIGSAMHRESPGDDSSSTSPSDTAAAPSTDGIGGDSEADHIPAHSTHPETSNLGTSGNETSTKP